jgi:hypothetical protein
MWLTGGLVAGTALGVAAERFDLIETARARLGFATERPPRVWRVGLQPSSDFATIGEALQAASPGDTVSVGPGEYREAVVFKSGVSIDAARDSVLRPPLGASAGFTAVTIRDAGSGRLRGLSIVGTPDQPVGTGVAVERSSVAIEEIEVSGAVTAGVAFGPGGQPVLRGSHVHGNPGPGITVAALAEPRLERNVILQNGSAGGPAPAVLVAAGARPILTGNGLAGRGAPAVQGWPAAGLAELVRQNVLSPDPIARPAEERRRPPPRPR